MAHKTTSKQRSWVIFIFALSGLIWLTWGWKLTLRTLLGIIILTYLTVLMGWRK